MKTLHLSVLMLASPFLAEPVHAQTLDLILGFSQAGATNDVLINFGNVTSYTPGWHNLGNYRSILSANFTDWNVATGAAAVSFGAAAAKPGDGGPFQVNPIYLTSSWNTAVSGTPGRPNSLAWTVASFDLINSARAAIGKVDTAYGSFSSVGEARAITSSGANSWTTNAQPGGTTAFGAFSAPQFNTEVSDLAFSGLTSFAAADLYSLTWYATSNQPEVSFVGTLVVAQNGTIAFAVVPEPAGCALALAGVALAALVVRRRRLAAATGPS